MQNTFSVVVTLSIAANLGSISRQREKNESFEELDDGGSRRNGDDKFDGMRWRRGVDGLGECRH